MSKHAAITVLKPREELERLWHQPDLQPEFAKNGGASSIRFIHAPGNRGTEIHVEVKSDARGGVVGEMVQKAFGNEPYATTMDQLRRFKQLVETGVTARSDSTPEGERVDQKLKQRPAQPQEVGV